MPARGFCTNKLNATILLSHRREVWARNLSKGFSRQDNQNQEYEPGPLSECRVFLTDRLMGVAKECDVCPLQSCKGKLT